MLSRELFLGIDVGTTSVKAALVDSEGRPAGQQYNEYPTRQLRPLWVEQSPWDWWRCTVRTVRQLLSGYKRSGDRILGMCISCQAPTCLGLDAQGQPVGDAIICVDRRAQEICDQQLEPLREHIFSVCGNRIDPYFFLPKLLWVKQNRPDEDKRTVMHLQLNGWLIFQLTGEYSLDSSHLVSLQFYDVFNNCWDQELCSRFELDADAMPPIFPCHAVVGQITAKAGAELGLEPGIPVAAGCTDASAVGRGLYYSDPGSLFEMSGQSSGLGLVTEQPCPHPQLLLSKGAIPGLWSLKGSMSASGGSLKWFRDNIDGRPGDSTAYQDYDRWAAASSPGAGGLLYLPYLLGERAPIWDSWARGVFFGLHAGTEKKDLLRAIMEGAAFGLRGIKECFSPQLLRTEVIFGAGGGYRSQLWSQIKADVLNAPILVQKLDFDAACMGDALLAMQAAGRPLPQRQRTIEAEYLPNPANAQLYAERFQLYQELYKVNRQLFHRLA